MYGPLVLLYTSETVSGRMIKLMSPEDLAARHPTLYHVTSPGMWPSIARHGLVPADQLAQLFGVDAATQSQLTRRRRAAEVLLHHPLHGTAFLTDNIPLSERALSVCLDDGLAPADWLAMLNARVFFWPDRESVDRLLGARANRNRPRQVLAFDTLGLVRAHAERVELSPINSGATIRKPARRGLATYTRLTALSYRDWQRARGGRDTVREVVVRGGVPDIATYLLGIKTV